MEKDKQGRVLALKKLKFEERHWFRVLKTMAAAPAPPQAAGRTLGQLWWHTPRLSWIWVGISVPTRGPGSLPCLSVPHPTSPFSFNLTFLILQVSQDGKALLDVLQRPLSPGNSESLTATANYSKAVHQVLDVVHEVLHHQRRLESIWQHRKVRLHQRLQLCVFQQDVQQVPHCSPARHLSQTRQACLSPSLRWPGLGVPDLWTEEGNPAPSSPHPLLYPSRLVHWCFSLKQLYRPGLGLGREAQSEKEQFFAIMTLFSLGKAWPSPRH